MLENIARVQLAELPTPIHEAPRLAKAIGLSKLFIKRDDLTGLAMGGNKARKLEYEFAQALNEGCDVVVTVGGIQSNHTRMTAAAARKSGIEPKIILGGSDFTEVQGNLLIQVLLGAEIRLVKDDSLESLSAAQNAWIKELREQGRKPYLIPVGGSTGLGALGYVNAMSELAGQVGQEAVQVVLAVGSCGTLAGTILGVKLFLPGARVIGISVSRSASDITLRTREIIDESCAILKKDIRLIEGDIEAYDNYHEEYGKVTESGKEAILLSARTEGLLLDPVYTGKAMAGLIGLVADHVIDPRIATIFLHTGGIPGLFAYENYFRDLTWCSRSTGG